MNEAFDNKSNRMNNCINNACCIIGRDSSDVERRELSAGVEKLFRESFHALDCTEFLLKVRENFLNVERGAEYSLRAEPPRSFFYCPLPVKGGKRAAAVFGECGIYGGGREFRYAHYYIEDFEKLDARTLLAKLFSSYFCGEDEITEILDRDRTVNSALDLGGKSAFAPNFSVEVEEGCRNLVLSAVEQLCAGKTVVIRSVGDDFNLDSKRLLAQIMSMLPCDLRKSIGFATYLQPTQIIKLRAQSNNVRLIIVDSDVDLSEISSTEPFRTFDVGDDCGLSDFGEDIALWSGVSFDERELQLSRFQRQLDLQRIPTDPKKILAKMAEISREAEKITQEFKSSDVKRCRDLVELGEYFRSFGECRVSPLMRSSFAKRLPEMLPDGLTSEEILLDAFDSDETAKLKRRCDELELRLKNISVSTATDKKNEESAKSENAQRGVGGFLRQREVKLLLAAAAGVSLIVGLIIGLLI